MFALGIALTLHLLSAVVWVGGMFAAYLCLKPAAGVLEPPQRLTLWRGFLARFFLWVWVSIVLLLASGLWMMLGYFGGMSGAPVYIHVMMGLGIVMMLLYAWAFHGPWLKFKRAVDAKDWAGAGAQLNRIRPVIAINLPLGLIVAIIGGTGRYWGA